MMLVTGGRPALEFTRVVVVGTGAAGLSALLHLAAAGVDCVAVTRRAATGSATSWAQGGLAAVWDASDSLDAHVADTLAAGAGLCDEAVVRDLVASAPGAISRLIEAGARFDRDASGAPITDPGNPNAYLTHRLTEDPATPLPTLGITIAF